MNIRYRTFEIGGRPFMWGTLDGTFWFPVATLEQMEDDMASTKLEIELNALYEDLGHPEDDFEVDESDLDFSNSWEDGVEPWDPTKN